MSSDTPPGFFERHGSLLFSAALGLVILGGIVEVLPLFYIEKKIVEVDGVRPYSPLELAGKDIYMRENCSVCHSQKIRETQEETERFGHYSLPAESMYDHPYQWGSKRTGPDLARVGGRRSDQWHVAHLSAPRALVPQSIMPSYSFLLRRVIDGEYIADSLIANRRVGVPYTDEQIEHARADFLAQADMMADTTGLLSRYPGVQVRNFDGQAQLTEMDALVAYLQVLGTMVDFSTFDPSVRR